MEGFDSLAEIAATLIGFVGIFAALRKDTVQIGKAEFVDFLQSAIGVVIFAFVPSLMTGLFESTEIVWRVSCGLFATFHLGIMVYATSLHFGVRGSGFGPLEYGFVLCSIVIVAMKVAIAFGYLLGSAYHVYLLGLVWLVFNSLFSFYRIIAKSLWGVPDEDGAA